MVITLLPMIGLSLGLATFWAVVAIVNARDFNDDATKRDKRLVWRRKAVRLLLFSLFLIYPGVSGYILNTFACKEVAGTSYMLVDFSLKCYDDQWKDYAAWAGICIVLFPVGIPTGFFLLLLKNRKKLEEPAIRQSLGFLYEAFSLDVWYFEMCCMAFKLFLTSVLLFFPAVSQMPVAMAVCNIYLIAVLLKRPFAHSMVERLEIVSVSCLSQIYFSGFVLFTVGHPGVGSLVDVLMSMVLISITMVVLLLFGWQAFMFGKRVVWSKTFKRMKSVIMIRKDGSLSSMKPRSSESQTVPGMLQLKKKPKTGSNMQPISGRVSDSATTSDYSGTTRVSSVSLSDADRV
jgi:hypothetical protein